MFDRSSSDYLEIKISDYALTLKKGSPCMCIPSAWVTEVVALKYPCSLSLLLRYQPQTKAGK